MIVRSGLIAPAAVVLLSAFPGSASAAAKTEDVNRSVFDASPEHAAASLHVDGATAGELGGAMDVTVRAIDGLSDRFGSCEPAWVKAVVTVQPGKIITVRTRGEVCAHMISGSISATPGSARRI